MLWFFCWPPVYAKDPPAQVIVWPDSGEPVLRFSFGKFKEVGSSGGQHTYVTDATAENLWTKVYSCGHFFLYLFDKNRVRIGEGMGFCEQRRPTWRNDKVSNHCQHVGHSGFPCPCAAVVTARVAVILTRQDRFHDRRSDPSGPCSRSMARRLARRRKLCS